MATGNVRPDVLRRGRIELDVRLGIRKFAQSRAESVQPVLAETLGHPLGVGQLGVAFARFLISHFTLHVTR